MLIINNAMMENMIIILAITFSSHSEKNKMDPMYSISIKNGPQFPQTMIRPMRNVLRLISRQSMEQELNLALSKETMMNIRYFLM